MSESHAAADYDRDQRTALLLELLPLVGGVIILLFVIMTGLQPTDEHGRTSAWHAEQWMGDRLPLPLELLVGSVESAITFALMGVFLLFFFSGIGWIISGHGAIGFSAMAVRGFVSLGVFAVGGSAGGSMTEAAVYFAISMAMAAMSVLALAFATRPRTATLGMH